MIKIKEIKRTELLRKERDLHALRTERETNVPKPK